MQDKQVQLEPEGMYHIYNRANGHEQLFLHAENYRFFLEKYQHYISPIAQTYCYCLMPNHFHFIVKIRSEEELLGFSKATRTTTLPKFQTLEELKGNEELKEQNLSKAISKQFSKLFSSYTQAFNKVNHRKGSLFMKNFNRKKISDSNYLLKLIHYIHHNPVEARLVTTPKDWKYSSYAAFISNEPTQLERAEVLALFNDRDNFIYCHQELPQLTGIELF